MTFRTAQPIVAAPTCVIPDAGRYPVFHDMHDIRGNLWVSLYEEDIRSRISAVFDHEADVKFRRWGKSAIRSYG